MKKSPVGLLGLLLASSALAGPVDNFTAQVNSTISANGQGSITGAKLNSALMSVVPIFNSMGTWDSNGVFTVGGSGTSLTGITPAFVGAIAKSGDSMTGGLGLTQAIVNGPANFLTLPQGNAYPTFVALNTAVTSALPFGYPAQPGQTRRSSREWAAVFTMVDQTGGYPYPLGSPQSLADPSDKVALYAGMDCRAGGGPCWTYNSSLNIESGFAAMGHGATGAEYDINNNDKDSGGTDGLAGMVEPGYYGLAITGAGQFAVTAALSIGGPGTHAIFHRGIVDSGNAVDLCLLCEYGNAFRVIDAAGTGGIALDTSRGHYNVAVQVPLGAAVFGGPGVQGATIGGDSSVNIAPVGATAVRLGATNVPTASLGPFVVNQGMTVNGGSSTLANGTFTDPAPGVAYDLKIGGSGNGAIVAGPSRFLSTLFASALSETLFTPASSSAACTTGQFGDDAGYHYVCVASNTWKRVALQSF